MGAGVDSFVWNSFEFINCWDHGRELQVAITNGFGECYNPTECGSQDDGQKTTTHTQILYAKASGNTLSTSANPAFWLAPGEPEANPSPECSKGINPTLTSNYTTNKTVTILSNTTVQFVFSVYVPDDCTTIQIEGPTGYMPVDYNTYYTINTTSGAVNPVDNSFGEVPLPLIFSTATGDYAMGALGYNPGAGWSLSYAKFYFPNLSGPTDDTSKWSVVYRYGAIRAGTTLSFKTNICVGTRDTVINCMRSL